VAKKKSPEHLKEDEKRTTSMGLFNQAEAYWLSAMALEEAAIKSGFAGHPVRFCYYHALELYLKALLRQKYAPGTIADKFGHNSKRLVKEAKTLGLVVTDEDRDVFYLIGNTDAMIDVRYMRTGFKTWPTLEALRGTAKNVREGVGALLRKADIPVRL
jgi:HEPN domain-containing protein